VAGLGQARSAISIVNALPLGVGAAVGIHWTARSIARLAPGDRRTRAPAIEPRTSATPLVRTAARAALERYPPAQTGRRVRLRVRSSIPVARGLKSSSAVASSVVLAVARAGGHDPVPLEVARLVAEVGRSTGVSATGALDDALAGVRPGCVVTDNRHDAELRRIELGRDLGVALWIPPHTHPRSPTVRRRFAREPGLARRAVDLALAGDWAGAMDANSTLVEHAMGYRYGRLRAAVASAGAVASGVSGLGPALAVVGERTRLPALLRHLPRQGRRRTLGLFLEDAPPEGAP